MHIFYLVEILNGKKDGVWKKYSVREVAQTVNELSAGLLKLGISSNDNTPQGRDKISIISKNRPEWLMVDLAVQQIGAVLTPIYPTINIQELEFILNDADVKIVFVSDVLLFNKISSIKDRLPHLQYIFSFEHINGVTHWTEILNKDETFHLQIRPIANKTWKHYNNCHYTRDPFQSLSPIVSSHLDPALK